VIGVGAGWPAWLCASTARNWWAPSSRSAILRVFYIGTNSRGSPRRRACLDGGCRVVLGPIRDFASWPSKVQGASAGSWVRHGQPSEVGRASEACLGLVRTLLAKPFVWKPLPPEHSYQRRLSHCIGEDALRRHGQAAAYMASPQANHTKPREAVCDAVSGSAERRRRHSGGPAIQTGVTNRLWSRRNAHAPFSMGKTDRNFAGIK
jgi:hypothetical protein